MLGGALVVATLAVAGVLIVRAREDARPKPPPPPKFPATEPAPHPVIPSEPNARQPQAFCEARDIYQLASTLRAAQKQSLPRAKGAPVKGAPPACHDDAEDRRIVAAVDPLGARAGACVARDSQLDPEWSQMESAVAALGQCNECTLARDKRLFACKRVLELVDSAQSTVKF
jgi:hypothetical protein